VIGDLVLEWSKQARQRATVALEGAMQARASAERLRREVAARQHRPPLVADDLVLWRDDRLYEASVRAQRAHDRAARVRERLAELAARRAELLSGQKRDPSRDLEQAAEAARRAIENADAATQLAIEGYEHAAVSKNSSAAVHEQVAVALESRAVRRPEEQQRLLDRARVHRAAAQSDRQESATDRDTAEDLRRRR
jgi:hypothetical protein